jgi:hypothetical protein
MLWLLLFIGLHFLKVDTLKLLLSTCAPSDPDLQSHSLKVTASN